MMSLTETQKMCIGKRRTVKLGGFALQLDGMGWFLLAIAIIAIGILAFPAIRNMSKNSSQRVELTQLRDAVMEYQALRADGAAPTNLEQLLKDPCVTAANAADQQDHAALLAPNSRWSASGTVTDVWGTAYKYTVNADGSGTITSTGSGKNISIDF